MARPSLTRVPEAIRRPGRPRRASRSSGERKKERAEGDEMADKGGRNSVCERPRAVLNGLRCPAGHDDD